MKKKKFYTTTELALEIGVSTTTIWRAIDSRKLKAIRTPGGHCRIPAQEAERFVKLLTQYVGSEESKK